MNILKPMDIRRYKNYFQKNGISMPGSRLKKNIVAVEIGNDWLKVIEGGSSPSPKITRLILVKLADIPGLVSEYISDLFVSNKLDRRNVISYVPRNLVTTRVIELPSTDATEIDSMIELQISKQTPYLKEEVVSAHSVIGGGREGYTTVLLVIARRNIIDERIKTLEDAGIKIKSMVLSSEGVVGWLRNACPREFKEVSGGTIAILSVDSNYSDIIIVQNEKIVFTRAISMGINQFSREHESHWEEKFISLLQRTIELYRHESKSADIGAIFLVGPSGMDSLEDVIGSGIDIPLRATGLTQGVQLGQDADRALRDDKVRFVSPAALFGVFSFRGRSEIDLMPSGMKIQKAMEGKRRQLVITGVLAAALVTAASFLFLMNIYMKNSYLSLLKERISAMEKPAQKVARLNMETNLAKARLDARGSALNLLIEIHKLTPQKIYYTDITIEEESRVILKGRVPAMSEVFGFVSTLEGSDHFVNVKTTHTTTKKDETGEYVEFGILCVYSEG
ncbi:MAG: pilus assembly protein PilM [Candidatus Omnitrophota bacterium]